MPDSRTDNDRNNSLRAAIRNHPNFQAMYESLLPRTKEIVDGLMAGNASWRMIRKVHALTGEEAGDYSFLQSLAGGNPLMLPLLTNIILAHLEMDLDDFGKPEEYE